jgi:hypothetical protein
MSYIQNFFTSRDNNAQGNTYVGQQARLWWDPDRNGIYYSDGNTPGGILVGTGGGGGNGVPGGSNTQVQFNNAGAFGGSAAFTFNGLVATLTGNLAAGNILTNNYLYANGVSIFGNTPFAGNTSFSNISVTGVANLGNFTISDQTMSGTVAGRDITYATVGGNANLNVLGGFNIHSANLEVAPDFSVDTNGRIVALVPDTSNLTASFKIVGSADASTVDPQNLGVMLHITGQPSIPSRIYSDGAANYAAYVGRRYNGTSFAPTGVLSGQIISRVAATPYLLDGTWPDISTTRIDFVAAEDQLTTQQGSKIQLWTTPDGDTTPALVAIFEQEGIILTGNVMPSVTDTYTLGNSTNKWANVWVGPNSLFLEDSVLGNDAEVHVDNGIFFVENVTAMQVGNMQMTTDGLRLTTAGSGENIQIGENADTGYMEVNMVGIEFRDGTRQTTAAIPLSQKGNAFGVVPLNASTKIDPIYLPAGGINFLGIWNAANNSPTLADGVGNVGDEYIVGVAGTQDLGSGNITFAVGDFVLYSSANKWEDIPVGGSGVDSFNGRAGVVTLFSSDVTNALSNGSITNNFLAVDHWTFVAGAGIGLIGNSEVELGDTITVTNNGVTAAIGGTGVAVSSATGNVTFSIGQPVGGADSVSFLAVVANTTIQATGNITGGNLVTAGQVVATGNIRGGNLITSSGTVVNNGLTTSGNVTAGNVISTTLIQGATITATGNVTGGNIVTAGRVTATGNVTGGNLVGQNLTPTRVTFVGSGKEIDDDAEFTYNDVTNTLSVGNITASGNVTAAYFLGNGTQLTGVVTTGFPTVAANGTNLVADSATDTLTLAAGNNIVLTGNATTDTAAFAVSESPVFSGNVTAPYYYGNGSTLTGTTGGSTFYGQFWSTISQPNDTGNAVPMTLDTSDAFNTGVSIAVGNISHIVIANPGVYNIQFSAQFSKTDSGQDTVSVWLAKDGVNVADSCTDIDLNGNNAKSVAAWNWLVNPTVANTYYEIYWSSSDSAMSLLSIGARTTPTRPAVPSLIVTVTQA